MTTSDVLTLTELLDGVDTDSPLFQRCRAQSAGPLRDLLHAQPRDAPPYALMEGADGGTFVQLAPDTADAVAQCRAIQWEERAENIDELGIDIETFSTGDLPGTGVYKYTEAEGFTVLLFGYSINGGPVRVVDFARGETLPPRVREALTDPRCVKTAFNAAFERTCLSAYYGIELAPEQWDCTMIAAARLGLPLSLEQCAEVLGLRQQKLRAGRALIRKFSVPCKPTKANGGRTRNRPEDAPEDWKTFVRYNRRDVQVEQAIRRRIAGAAVPEQEHRLLAVDQRINRRGVRIDRTFAENAQRCDLTYREHIRRDVRELTGLENPQSVAQLKGWLERQTGRTFPTLRKETMPAITATASPLVRRVLDIRSELGKTSTAKYGAMLDCACRDDRVRGLLQFYGTRTGRWAGRLVQVQNLPQNHLADLERARELVRRGDLDELELMYGNVPATLSELVRTAFVASPGNTLTVCDFSAIEARVIAWLAREEWALEVFRTSGKIYEATAARMYHCNIEEITKTDPRRQKGKIATLALGYEGGTGALAAMGAERMGLSEGEQRQIVADWRKANPRIVRLWRHLENAAKDTIRTRQRNVVERGVTFGWWRGAMTIQLPSGRTLYYPRAGLTEDGRVVFSGTDSVTHQWGDIETYGGKLTENVVQAIARDCLAEVLLRIEDAGYPVVFHVHDEVVVDYARPVLDELRAIFATPPAWAKDLPLRGDGYSTPFYKKN